MKKLITPKVIEETKKHFNCNTITGAYLEESETEPYHFETVIFRDELMTKFMDKKISITRMSMAVLEDSGWY